ncbi:aminoacylase-1-like [Bradysia coprophila]|uniref:aminoacylase-1-like n=1 Tax=Bradysia coprophila TaxID=38358 RepID=UPI00187DC650|nr:aminoacylase-1-like [Bradysia coprophila]
MFTNKCRSGLLGFAVLCAILGISLGDTVPELPTTSPWYGNEEIRIFREYLRYPTVHPNINYEPCVEFLKRQAAGLGLPVSVVYPVNAQNPVVVITWQGSQPDLPSIMLNSHTDVVPVFEQFWTHPPFAADVDETGRIYARGTQDTKGLGMIHLAAIRALKRNGVQLKRTIHVTFTPDEELGGFNGMAGFVASNEFKALNVGYALDEGGVSPTNTIGVFYDERCPWQIEFICNGPTGHASLLFEGTAGEKITYLMDKFMKMRKDEVKKSKKGVAAGKVTSINLTVLKGGVQANVVPPELRAIFDVRLGVDVDHAAFERQINKWCKEAGGNITINYLIKTPKAPASRTDSTNPMWAVIETTAKEFNITVVPSILVGATDMRFLRRENIPGFGFSPIINTPLLVHDNNEFVTADAYLAAINFFTKVLTNLGKI